MRKLIVLGALIATIMVVSLPSASFAQTQTLSISQLKAIVVSLQEQLNALISLIQQRNAGIGVNTGVANSDNNVVTLLSPNGGEIWNRSEPQVFKWRLSGEQADRREVYINLDNIDNGARYGSAGGLLTGNKASKGEISWTIPINYPAGRYKAIVIAGIGNDIKRDSSDNYFTIINQSKSVEDDVWEDMQNHYKTNKQSGYLSRYEDSKDAWDKWSKTVYISDNMMSNCLNERSNRLEIDCYSQFYDYITKPAFDGFYNLLIDRSKAVIRADDKQAIVNQFIDLTSSRLVREEGSSFPGKSIVTTYLVKKNGKWLIAYNSARQIAMDLVALGIPHDDKDQDLDGLMDNIEICVWPHYNTPIYGCRKIDPTHPDIDEDGWWDGIETFVFGTSPFEYDNIEI